MTKQPNTSNNKHKCPCKEFKMEWTMKDERAFQLGEKSGKKEGIKQGYAKALADVEKIVNDLKSSHNWITAEDFMQELAKLSHSQQDKQDRQCLNQHSSGGSADTHIPKLAKEKK